MPYLKKFINYPKRTFISHEMIFVYCRLLKFNERNKINKILKGEKWI